MHSSSGPSASSPTSTVVIKLGATSIIDEQSHDPVLSVMSSIAETCVKLRRSGHHVILVSSGATGIGMGLVQMRHKPTDKIVTRALAAMGQCRLISIWDCLFQQLRQPIAQVLLGREDVVDRAQYSAVSDTLSQLLDMGVIPIVNENGAVSETPLVENNVPEAIISGMVQATHIFFMTDGNCLYDRNPRAHPTTAKGIEHMKDTMIRIVNAGA